MANCALVLVDIQYDFLQDGALAVPRGNTVIPVVNHLLKEYRWTVICATQDFHPRNHISFAANHPGSADFDDISIEFQGVTQQQKLWPVHCVQGTRGCEIHRDIRLDLVDKICRKGYNSDLDSYSGFADSFDHEETDLGPTLAAHDIKRVFVVGLAEDYCVFQTALAAAKRGYDTFIIKDAVKGLQPLDNDQMDTLRNMNIKNLDLSSETLQSLKKPETH